MFGRIYIIKNTINIKVYIGFTTMQIKERFKNHLKPSTIKKRGSYKIYNAIQKYDKKNFYIELIEDNIPVDKLNEREIYWIAYYDSYKNGYNTTKGGNGKILNKISDIELIKERIINGIHITKIAKEIGINAITIRRSLDSIGYNINPKINKDILEKFIKQGKTNKEMALLFKVSEMTVSRARDKYKLKAYNKKVIFRDNFDMKHFLKDFVNGMKRNDICNKYGLSKTTMLRTFNKYKEII